MSDRQQVTNAKGERIAIVAGLRTPFAKQATAFHGVSALDMGKMVVNELLARSELDPKLIEQLVYGQVVQMPAAPNIAREIVLGTGMNVSTDAYSVTRACATSFQSAVNRGRIYHDGQYRHRYCGRRRLFFCLAYRRVEKISPCVSRSK